MHTKNQQQKLLEEMHNADSETVTTLTATDGEDSSYSSYSLQECIDELNARRIRHFSTQSRDLMPLEQQQQQTQQQKQQKAKNSIDEHDELDLINQNLHNKQQERKCKPCKNGFCYCFTSDSGDSAAAAARQSHPQRRTRKSEPTTVTTAQQNQAVQQSTKLRHSGGGDFVPPIKSTNQFSKSIKSPSKTKQQQQQQQKNLLPSHKLQQFELDQQQQEEEEVAEENATQLTAISRLESAAAVNAPLIHIIQELHNNCVISEVRVNRYKINARGGTQSLNASPQKSKNSTKTTSTTRAETTAKHSTISELDNKQQNGELQRSSSTPEGFMYSTSLESSLRSSEGRRARHKAAGRLLQKRLAQLPMHYKPRAMNKPPPKPPRSQFLSGSLSTLNSSTPSIKEANQIIDEFLRKRGVFVNHNDNNNRKQQQQQTKDFTEAFTQTPRENVVVDEDTTKTKRTHRKSFPLTTKIAMQNRPLPSCPSLSDLERVVVDTRKTHDKNYEKNLKKIHKNSVDKSPIKEIKFGWTEPKIMEMLQTNGGKEFKTQAVQAEPQTAMMGWQLPMDNKVNLDTVDGVVENLAINIGNKKTPIKHTTTTTTTTTKTTTITNKRHPYIRGQSPWTKSNLKCTQFSRDLLRKSKKKILRLVSPKKYNNNNNHSCSSSNKSSTITIHKRTIGVQTSPDNVMRNAQSPPGSYHSPINAHSSTPTTNHSNSPPLTSLDEHFDFSRIVQSPPRANKKATRKLNFPSSTMATQPKTYRSYHTDIDQDASFSKMGYILGNIRAKLEASDEHAVRTFQEIEHREQQNLANFDVVDGPSNISSNNNNNKNNNNNNNRNRGFLLRETSAEIHNDIIELYQRAATAPPLTPEQQQQQQQNQRQGLNEPIYSEIEEDSIIVKGSPQHDNKTGIQHFFSKQDPNAIYAQVNKHSKIHTPIRKATILKSKSPMPMALGQFLQNSITNLSPISEAPTYMPTSSSIQNSYSIYATDSLENKEIVAPLANSETTSSMQSQSLLQSQHSLNNIRMMEHDSPPRPNRNLSKSDLSLQRSEIFLENFCRSEFQLETDDKINNLEQSFASTTVSYEMPDNDISYSSENHLTSSHDKNQSTPKKLDQQERERQHSMSPEVFMTKTYMNAETRRLLEMHAAPMPNSATPLPSTTHSLDSTFGRCKRITNALRKSFRKSCNLVKLETKKLSKSLNIPTKISSSSSPMTYHTHSSSLDDDEAFITAGEDSLGFSSSYNLETLFTLNDETPVTQQIAHAVSICRQLPVLEVSAEMVEAERLLLFSTLRNRQKLSNQLIYIKNKSQATRRIYIDGLRLPVRENPSQDLFFNYFYIVTFVCGNYIHSTQSVECCNQEAIFNDCGIEFNCSGQQDDGEWAEVRCEIFMLRLRKVSTLSLEPRRTPIVRLPSSDKTSGGSSNNDEIVSRFRLHASFTLQARDFVPYEFVEHETHRSNIICMRTSKNCILPLKSLSKSSNLRGVIQVQSRAEARFPKNLYMGLLNVQEPLSTHNWNQRWCILDGLHLSVWRDANDIEKLPLFLLDLRQSVGPNMTLPLTECSRELCARQRSFKLQAVLRNSEESESEAIVPIYFAAETQTELQEWLKNLNATLQLIENWLI